MDFQGLPEGRFQFDRLPTAFFSELLPQIDHLGELKVTLYVLWKLDNMEGDLRYLVREDFINDTRFFAGLSSSTEELKNVLDDSIERCINRGTLLKTKIQIRDQPTNLYFFNSPRGRESVKAIENGMWRPSDDIVSVPIELIPERPNIYNLYEKNIGPITPLLAEALDDAEKEFPIGWIEEAFRIAVEKNVRNWRYIEAILRRWQERGYDVREDRRDTEKIRQQYADWED
jgi:DnaD/phage-associated family protein